MACGGLAIEGHQGDFRRAGLSAGLDAQGAIWSLADELHLLGRQQGGVCADQAHSESRWICHLEMNQQCLAPLTRLQS